MLLPIITLNNHWDGQYYCLQFVKSFRWPILLPSVSWIIQMADITAFSFLNHSDGWYYCLQFLESFRWLILLPSVCWIIQMADIPAFSLLNHSDGWYYCLPFCCIIKMADIPAYRHIESFRYSHSDGWCYCLLICWTKVHRLRYLLDFGSMPAPLKKTGLVGQNIIFI